MNPTNGWGGRMVVLWALLVLLEWVGWKGFYAEAHHGEWRYDTYPNPRKDLDQCGRLGMRSWTCDPDGVISYKEANLLDQQVQELYSSTQSRCACGKCNETVSTGYRVSVAIMEGILITSIYARDYDKLRALQEFADYLRLESWSSFGQCGEDIVIAVSEEDQQVYASVGPMVKGLLSSRGDCLHEMYSQARANFSTGAYYSGIKTVIANIRLAVLGIKDCGAPAAETEYYLTPLIALALLFVGSTIACLCYNDYRKKHQKTKTRDLLPASDEMDTVVV